MIIITIVIYFHFSHYLQKQRFLSTTQRSIRLNKLISYSFFCFNNIVFISRYNAHPNTKNDKCIIFLSCHLHISWNHTQTTHLIVYFFLSDGLNGYTGWMVDHHKQIDLYFQIKLSLLIHSIQKFVFYKGFNTNYEIE